MVSCGGGTTKDVTAIEETIRGYVTTFNAEDFDKCLTYFTDYEDKEDALAFLSYMRNLSGPLELREVKDIAIFPPAVPGSSQTATAAVSFTTIMGEEGTDQIGLKKVDSKWKIVWDKATTTKGTATILDAGDVLAIKDTVRGYFAAFNAEDYATCLTYLTNFSDDETEKSFLSRQRDFWGEAILQKVEVIETTGSSVMAEYQVIIEGSLDTNQLQLQKIDGQWKIILEYVALSPSINYMPKPAQGVLPGSVEIAPEFQRVLQAEHCSWMGEDGQLRTYWCVRNIGDQSTAPFVAMFEIYNTKGELLTYQNPSGILGPGEVMGTKDFWPKEDIVTQSAAYYKIIVKEE